MSGGLATDLPLCLLPRLHCGGSRCAGEGRDSQLRLVDPEFRRLDFLYNRGGFLEVIELLLQKDTECRLDVSAAHLFVKQQSTKLFGWGWESWEDVDTYKSTYVPDQG